MNSSILRLGPISLAVVVLMAVCHRPTHAADPTRDSEMAGYLLVEPAGGAAAPAPAQ